MPRFALLALFAVLLPAGQARADWNTGPPQLVTARLALETALQASAIEPDTTSTLLASTVPGPVVRRYDRIRGREHLEPTMVSAMSISSLLPEQGLTSDSTWYSEDDSICRRLAPAELEAVAGRLVVRSPYEPPMDGEAAARLVMGSGPDGSAVLAWLRPGNQVTVVRAERVGRKKAVVQVDLKQGGRMLRILEDESGASICYTPVSW